MRQDNLRARRQDRQRDAIGAFQTGDFYQDRANRTRYQISRVLRVGSNEFLIYLKPLPPAEKRRVGATDDLEPPI
jgi:hypothetical protein